MTWRDDLRRVKFPDGRVMIGASFRGVPFFVESGERIGGRRTSTLEFPMRDDPVVDDLGRKAARFPVEGYVLGDDYVRQRDTLRAALEDVAGPGELVHPYYGRRPAICSAMRIRESTRDGGMAVFTLEFKDTPAQVLAPTDEPDLDERVELSADAALVAVEAEFLSRYDVVGQASFALERLSDEVAALSTELAEKLSGVVTATQDVARLKQQFDIVTAQAAALVRTPGEIIGAFANAIGALGESVADAPQEIWKAFVDVYDLTPQPLAIGTTETRVKERENQTVLAASLRRAFIVEAARVVTQITFDALDDALEARLAVTERLDEQAAIADDIAYSALVQLRSDVARAVPGDAVLAQVTTVNQRSALPTLVLSHRLYGTVQREADLIARNAVGHPGFVSGELKVLSNV